MNLTAIFLVQTLVSLSLVAFSIGMLVSQRGETSVYLPLLSGIVSAWLPSPQAPKTPLLPLSISPQVATAAVERAPETINKLVAAKDDANTTIEHFSHIIEMGGTMKDDIGKRQ